MRDRVALTLMTVLALLLAGCSSIPMTGPVQTVAPQQQDDEGDRPAFVPNGPTDGMSPEEVVSGFVVAQSAGGGYEVAKEFLTADFARSWRPDDSVLVHAAQWSVDRRSDSGDRVRLRVPAVAEVDPSGRYSPTDRSPSKDFELQRVRGQWRISGGPSGIVLSVRAFPSVFRAVQLQFFTPDYRRLVPDVRWFPRSDDTAPDVVRTLLDGASPVLQGITAPVFPAGTDLAAPVRTSGGIVTVSIRVPGTRPAEQATDRIQQALAAGLGGMSSASLRLVVNGVQAPVAPATSLEQPSISDPVVVAGERFGTVTAQGAVQEDRELGPDIVKLKPTAITVSARQRLAALLTRGGQVDVVTRQGTRIVDERPDLIPPTLDQRGWTYSVPSNEPTGLRASYGDRDPVAIDADLGTEILSIEVSADGTRLLVLDRTEAGPEAYVAGILRDSDGAPVALSTDRYVVPVGGGEAVDATWVDSVSVAVLTSVSSVQSVTVQQLGGISTTLGSLSNARSIVGGSGQLDLRARVGTGQILRSSTSGAWAQEFPAGLEADVLAVQR